jgi:hypothetical protein
LGLMCHRNDATSRAYYVALFISKFCNYIYHLPHVSKVAYNYVYKPYRCDHWPNALVNNTMCKKEEEKEYGLNLIRTRNTVWSLIYLTEFQLLSSYRNLRMLFFWNVRSWSFVTMRHAPPESKQSTAQWNQTAGRSQDMAVSMHIYLLPYPCRWPCDLCPRLQEGYQGLHNLLWPAEHARYVKDQRV